MNPALSIFILQVFVYVLMILVAGSSGEIEVVDRCEALSRFYYGGKIK